MTAIITLLAVIALSMLIVKIGTIALTMTGLSEEVASFQSLSAFSGAGFTTGEAESVVLTEARRNIIKTLIRCGSAGVVTVIASLILSFGGEGGTVRQFLILGAGVAVLMVLARSGRVHRMVTPLIRWALRKSAAVELRDYASLLHLGRGYSVAEVTVTEASRLKGGKPEELGLTDEGITILGLLHGGEYIGAPATDHRLQVGDRLVVYGLSEKLVALASDARADLGAPKTLGGNPEDTVARIARDAGKPGD